MGEIFWRLAWIFVIACVAAYASFLVATTLYAETDTSSNVVIRDVIERGVHNLSGMIPVPSLCTQLSSKVVQMSTSTYLIDFKTWEEPYRDCNEENSFRAFKIIAFAPSAGVEFMATLDKQKLPIVILPITKKDNYNL